MFTRLLSIFLFILFVFSCSKNEEIYFQKSTTDGYTLYQQGYEAFQKNDFFFASKKFAEAELNFKEVELAAKSSIMSSFSLYGINFYNETLEGLQKFLKTYPSDKNIIYAHYLIAIIYFEQISD